VARHGDGNIKITMRSAGRLQAGAAR
jgi:hypothetical protein